jgi:hypothetical protein
MGASGDVQKTIEKYRLAQKEFVKGNPGPFKDVCSHADDVTILGGWGGFEKGWAAQVERRYDWASARFATNGDDERTTENISLVVTPEIPTASILSGPKSASPTRPRSDRWRCGAQLFSV